MRKEDLSEGAESLPRRIETRWNTLYEQLEAFVRLEEPMFVSILSLLISSQFISNNCLRKPQYEVASIEETQDPFKKQAQRV